MEVIKADPDKVEIELPQNIYLHLQTINGISFTPRETDVIACILSGRAAKKIAIFLSISPKTVKNHIHNIMQKLGCRSQESIIDFVEKSGKFKLVKNYYSNLLIQATFESELIKVSKLINNKNITCYIVCSKEQKEKTPHVSLLGKHLTLSGIKSLVIFKEDFDINSVQTTESQNACYIIYILDPVLIENLQSEKHISPSGFIEKSVSIIFLVLDKNLSITIPQKSFEFKLADLIEQKNHYSLVLQLLKYMLPMVPLNENIMAFNKQHETLHEYFPKINCKRNDINNYSFASILKNKINRILAGSAIVLICLHACYLIFYKTISQKYNLQEIQSLENNLQNSKKYEFSSLLSYIKIGKSVTWNLPRQDINFIGREKLLEDLFAKLHVQPDLNITDKQKKDTIPSLIVTACTGLGGVGKTQLTLQYILNTKFPYTLRAWFPAENLDQLRQKYLELSKELGYSEETPSMGSVIAYVKRWFINNPGWLIVYDNVDSYKEIEPFLPESGGHVILTTRQRYWPNNFKTLYVDVMTEKESTHLLQSLISSKNILEETEMKQLAKTLGHLPLVLAQAGSYIQQNGISISKYLNLYNNHEAQLLLDNTLPEGINNVPVAVTWNVTLETISKEDKMNNGQLVALNLLTICAYLAPEEISRELLLTWLKKAYPDLTAAELVLSKTIGQLSKYSLINTDDKGNINIHRLLQSVIRHQHQSSSIIKNIDYPKLNLTWYNLLIKATIAEFVRNTQTLEEENRQKNLLPHLLSIINHYESIWPNQSSPDLGLVSRSIAFAFCLLSHHKTAQFYGDRALKIFEQHYGINHLEVAKTLNNLGYYHIEMGNAKLAKELLERSYRIKNKYYGKDNDDSALTMSNLGSVYSALGDSKQAKLFQEKALKIMENYKEEKPLWTALILTRLGDTYGALGDTNQRKEILDRALEIRKMHYGTNHPEYARTLVGLGDSYGHLGNAKRKKELLECALDVFKKSYGENHPEVAKTLTMLGDAFGILGDAKQQENLSIQALSIQEKYYGKEHPEIATTLINLSYAYRALGNFQKAKEFAEQALKIRAKYYGEEHPKVGIILTALGNIHGDLGNNQQKKIFIDSALKIEERHYGTNHPRVAKILTSLGSVYRELGNIAQAQEFLERALSIRKQFYGERHVEVAKTLTELSSVYVDLGDIQRAKQLLDHTLEIRKSFYGEHHPEVSKTLNELGNIHKLLKNFSLAKELLQRALDDQKSYFGKDHPSLTTTLNNLGGVYRDLGEQKLARKLLERSFDIREKYYGHDHTKVAETLLNLIPVYIKLKEMKIAYPLAQRCYNIYLQFYGKQHTYTLQSLDLLENISNSINMET